MNETMTSEAASRQHSTGRVVGAALVGVALGIAGVSLLSPSPADDASAATPPASSGEVAPPEPADIRTDTADGSPPTSTDESGGADATTDATTPENGVVDQATAEQAAIDFLGEGRVTWVSPEDDYGAAWEVEVTLPSGREVDVYVDAAGQVVDTS